jgi:hypothetical protein
VINWWVFPAQLVENFHIPMREAWSMTLREYTMLFRHKETKPVVSTYDRRDLDDILASFEVKEL